MLSPGLLASATCCCSLLVRVSWSSHHSGMLTAATSAWHCEDSANVRSITFRDCLPPSNSHLGFPERHSSADCAAAMFPAHVALKGNSL